MQTLRPDDTIAQALPQLTERCPAEVADALHSALGRDAEFRHTTISEVDEEAVRRFADAIAPSALSSLGRLTFARAFPTLKALGDQHLATGEFGTRLENRLRALQIDQWSQLLDLRVDDPMRWENIGVNSVTELIRHAIVAALTVPKTNWTEMAEPGSPANESDLATRTLVEAIQEIAAYGTTIDPDASWIETLHELSQDAWIPPRVAESLNALRQVTCEQIAGQAASDYDLSDLTRRILDQLNDRELEVLRRRVLALGPVPTLEEVGEDFKVTRERVRQIGEKAIAKVTSALEAETFAPLSAASERLRTEIGIAGPLTELPAQLEGLTADPDPSADLTPSLLGWLAGPYRTSDGWLVRRDIDDLRRIVRTQIKAASRDGILSLAEAGEVLERVGFRGTSGRRWLDEDPRLQVTDDLVLIWDGTLQDKAASVLRLGGNPMSVDEMVDAIGEDRSPRTLGNAISTDDRFIRRGKTRWGLAEWGGDEYTSTVDLMLEEIEARGGEASVEDLIESITTRFPDVVPGTITSYASSVQFVRTKRGVIRPRRPSDPYISDGRVELARDSFLVDGQWALRVRVNKDHLRGSGFLIPTAFAVRLGIRPSDRIEFDSEWGTVSIAWRTQTTMSSIRAIVNGLGAEEEDLVFLRFLQPDRVEARLVRAMTIEGATPDEQLLLQVGADQFSPDPLVAIGRAIGLASPEHASNEEIEARLRAKGDEQLIPLIPRGRDTTHAAIELMAMDEGQQLELKETLSLNTRSKQRDKEVEHSVLKTVAGFLNAEGGVLFIGVTDQGIVTGVEPDLKLLNKDLDRYELHLRTLLTTNLGDATVATGVAIRFHKIERVTVAEVRVDQSPDPVYAPDKNGFLTLFVRSGNETKSLPINEAVKYIDRHFGGERFAREVLESSGETERA